jgi:hypothetical protein
MRFRPRISNTMEGEHKYATNDDLGEIGESMARKKRVKLWQVWHVESAQPALLRTDRSHPCYQIIARRVRERKNYWVAVNTRADPPMWGCFAVFDDYGHEVEPDKAMSRVLSRRCLPSYFCKTNSLQGDLSEPFKDGSKSTCTPPG